VNDNENGNINGDVKLDKWLKQGLASTVEPAEELNQSIINQFKERNPMNRVTRKRISAGILVAVVMLVMSVSAYAATQLFSSKQVAEHLGEQILALAFESSDAIEINQTVASGDYNFTLHGIVSGAGLKGLNSAEEQINPARSYAVVSIAKEDGSPMPSTSDPEYGKEPFFVSPLVKGLKPWQVNILTMHGGYSETVVDGIMYRLIECDDVEMFADRGVYLAIIGGETFYNKDAFTYNEATGKVTPNQAYTGTSLLFDLPLDKAKADPAKAAAYLQDLLKEPTSVKESVSNGSNDASDDTPEKKFAKEIEGLKAKIPNGTVIPESVQTLTPDDKGYIHYSFDDWSNKILVSELFREGQTGFSEMNQISGDGTIYKALQFSRDENGVITGRIVVLD